uniref:Uncharacterized protein n=1 Tax=viral metagenome TaxID=1070528 RepID=A0A6C0C6S8_9ZZZZ
MDTKIPNHWKELRLEFVEPSKYKTYKVLINDHKEHCNRSEKNNIKKRTKKSTPENHSRTESIIKKTPYPRKIHTPRQKCVIQ